MREYKEYTVLYRRSWAEQLRQGRALQQPINWGVSADSSGKAHVDMQEALNGWLHAVLCDLTSASAAVALRMEEPSIGPFVFTRATIEYGNIARSLSLVLRGRIVLAAQTALEAEALLDQLLDGLAGKERGGHFTVLSGIETLATSEEEG